MRKKQSLGTKLKLYVNVVKKLFKVIYLAIDYGIACLKYKIFGGDKSD